MRIIEHKNVMVGDWLTPCDEEIVHLNCEWPQQVMYVYKTVVGGQVRVKFNESQCGHSDAPACMFTVFRREECD